MTPRRLATGVLSRFGRGCEHKSAVCEATTFQGRRCIDAGVEDQPMYLFWTCLIIHASKAVLSDTGVS